jgi:hypothetical protein
MFHSDREGRVDQGAKLMLGDRPSIGLMCSFSRVAKERKGKGKSNDEILPGYCCLDTPFESGGTWGIKVRCIITSELDLTLLPSRSSSNKLICFTFDLKFTSLIARRTDSTIARKRVPSSLGMAKRHATSTLERIVDSHVLARD